MIIGVDVGGTFIDLVAVDETGGVIIHKVPSTASDQGRAVLDGLEEINISPVGVERIVHGTTIGTNAILERRGARVAFVTTSGFRDILEIGRAKRMVPGTLFKPFFVRPHPLVPRSLCFEVRERTLHTGEILLEVQEEDVARICQQLRELGVEALAVCFLHSYANPANEEQVREFILKYLNQFPISLSSEVVPEHREFERYSTTVMNAYIQPLMENYLNALESSLAQTGYKKRILTVASSGGILTVETAVRFPVRTIMSGPAGGVVQSVLLAKQLNLENVITYDMGGTSTDVCLIKSCEPHVSTESLIGAFPLKISQLDINSVGAGGGSIGWVDLDGALRVGPKSAGAYPGPAAYGRGGNQPTVTDANVLLNRLSTRRLLGRAIRLRRELAQEAFQGLAGQFPQLTLHQLAEGVIRLAVVRMVGAIREISIQRGHDPREFVLIAFGGAGPMHATQVADELRIHKVLIPRFPGNFSALGLANCDLKHDYVKTRLSLFSKVATNDIVNEIAHLEQRAFVQLASEAVKPESMVLSPSLDLRYLGQAFELNVPVDENSLRIDAIAGAFHELHRRTFGHSDQGAELELVNVRLTALGIVNKLQLPRLESHTRPANDAIVEKRSVFFNGQFLECQVYERDRIPTLTTFSGPALAEEFGTTTVVFPLWQVTVDAHGNFILDRIPTALE